jgi:hypothetical protein
MFDSMFEIWNRKILSLSVFSFWGARQKPFGFWTTCWVEDGTRRNWNLWWWVQTSCFMHNPSLYFQHAAKLRCLDSLPPIKNKQRFTQLSSEHSSSPSTFWVPSRSVSGYPHVSRCYCETSRANHRRLPCGAHDESQHPIQTAGWFAMVITTHLWFNHISLMERLHNAIICHYMQFLSAHIL